MTRLRVLVLSHSYIMKPWRRKFALMAEDPNVDIRVVTPDRWYEGFREVVFEPDSFTRCQEFAYPIRFSGSVSSFYYRDGLKTHFRDFQPHIIHLEEEPWSFNAFQTLRLKRRFCPESYFLFRTSASIPLKLRFEFLRNQIVRYVFRQAHVAFPLTQNAGKILRRSGYRGKLVPIPNGIDLRLFRKFDADDLKTKLGLQSCFVIGYAGRLVHAKGLDTLFQAVTSLDFDYQLLIVGRGDYKPRLLRLANSLGISERIVWVDAVPPESVPAYINCMDTLVLPSRTTPGWVELFGRVLAEGMACEVPVIASDSGEILNIVGNAGLFFPEENAWALADGLRRIRYDDSLRMQLIERGLGRVKEFTWEKIAQTTLQVYWSLASGMEWFAKPSVRFSVKAAYDYEFCTNQERREASSLSDLPGAFL